METLDGCPICTRAQAKEVLKCKDFTVSGEQFSIVECEDCGFWYTNPRPDEQAIGAYYKSEDYISHTDSSKGLINRIYQVARTITVRNKYLLVNSLSHGKNLLDYGCGTGDFLKYCKDHGMTTTGFEPDPDARKVGAEKNQIDIVSEEDLFGMPDGQFDIVTLWHVLEHVHRLKETIGQLQRLLRKKGVLVVAVPNHTSKDAHTYKEFWAAYDVPRHIYHFAPTDIQNLFAQFNMELVEALPMKLDSYYVSMLSEKYKNGSIVKAVVNGLRSNVAASSKHYTWSSQIYVLRNKVVR